jgi:MerR family transcriptional regulator, heat shock protein HspR
MWALGGPSPDSTRGVYGISVAAELVGTGVQNLRLYEARGLLEPERTQGGTRRYSADDLDRLRRISTLLDAGLNLAGISMVLDLEAQNTALRAASKSPEPQALNAPAIQASKPPTRASRPNQVPSGTQPSGRKGLARSGFE